VLPLGLDTFAIAAALGIVGTTSATRRRISALFTAFEAGMPLIGVLRLGDFRVLRSLDWAQRWPYEEVWKARRSWRSRSPDQDDVARLAIPQHAWRDEPH
jgi:hypothetical protein